MMKHENLISKMTLEEKAAFLSGKTVFETRDIKRLGIPSIFCSDGPHGVRKQVGEADHLGLNASVPATCFPTAATIANSWDENLGEEIGRALGEEAAALSVNVLLGPGLNIKRSPLCGRNFEYFSEDPYLSGKMAASYVKGIQSQGVYACPKHFAVNNQELRRMAMNAVIDERTLREIYLTGFEIAIKEGKAKAIMTSYNEVNGVYANENNHLLKDILREEWGFEGIVITDWGGSNDHVKGVAAGSNLEMPAPGLDSARQILEALESGKLEEREVDECVDGLLDAALFFRKNNEKKDFKSHHELAQKAAAQSMVLLKNDGNLLPLDTKIRIAIIGDFAFVPRYQGAGSSAVIPTKLDSMEELAGKYGLSVIGIGKGYMRTGEKRESLLNEALKLVSSADVVLFCFGLDELSESEGLDRNHMRIPENQTELLEKIAEVNPNVVGILSGGAAVEMPWSRYCKAILHGYLNGQAGAGATFDVLTGKVNPCGKLAETYPYHYEDTPAFENFPAKERNSEYRESVFVGYRYYETAKVAVRYPFGYGLSYTTFAYSDMEVSETGVSFILTNTGIIDGAEIVQMYVGLPGAKIFRPKKELKGFRKVFLKAGECVKVRIPFDDKTFRYWSVSTNRWETEEGEYLIMIGAGSADIRLSAKLARKGTTQQCPYRKEDMSAYYSGQVQKVDDVQFTELLGTPIPEGHWSGELCSNDAICQMYYAKSRLARLVYKILTRIKVNSEKKGQPNLNVLFIYNMPFRAIAKMTNGMVSMEMVDGIMLAVNGHLFRGLRKIVSGYFSNRKENEVYEEKLEQF